MSVCYINYYHNEKHKCHNMLKPMSQKVTTDVTKGNNGCHNRWNEVIDILWDDQSE